MYHEKTQTDKQLYDRLCPIIKKKNGDDTVTEKREYSEIMLRRLVKLGYVSNDTTVDNVPDLTEQQISKFVRLDS